MPPEIITKLAPTAMMAMKLVSFANCARFWALRNLFLSTTAASRSPCSLRRKTRWRSPWALIWKRGILTLPPNTDSRAPRTTMTMSSPPSCKRSLRRAVESVGLIRSQTLTNTGEAKQGAHDQRVRNSQHQASSSREQLPVPCPNNPLREVWEVNGSNGVWTGGWKYLLNFLKKDFAIFQDTVRKGTVQLSVRS